MSVVHAVVAPPPPPERTKTRLLELVKRHGPQTAQELAQRLEVSIPAARRHLGDLQDQHLIECRTERPGGRGRPQHVFALTERGEAAFPKTYSGLCLDVLRQVEALYGEGAVLRVLQGRNADLAAHLESELGAGDTPATRLERLAAWLCAHGYDAELEWHPGGGCTLVQRNCPHLTVARAYGALCDSELALYRALLGDGVTRDSRIACGQGVCRYHLGPGHVG